LVVFFFTATDNKILSVERYKWWKDEVRTLLVQTLMVEKMKLDIIGSNAVGGKMKLDIIGPNAVGGNMKWFET
jgi:hypothetical protein